MSRKKIVCLYGGPGAGKSTTCAGVFYKLKMLGFNCEMNREYIKEWVWEKRPVRDGDQTYIFAKQARRERLYIESGIDYIITDSPLILTHFYGIKHDLMEQMCNTSLNMLKNHHEFCKLKGYSVEHYVLNRVKPFNQEGRWHTEEESVRFDQEIRTLLMEVGINYKEVDGDESALEFILNDLNNLAI